MDGGRQSKAPAIFDILWSKHSWFISLHIRKAEKPTKPNRKYQVVAKGTIWCFIQKNEWSDQVRRRVQDNRIMSMIKKNSFTKPNQVNKTPDMHQCRALQSRRLDVNKNGVNQPEKQQGHIRSVHSCNSKINWVLNVIINHNNHGNKNKCSKNMIEREKYGEGGEETTWRTPHLSNVVESMLWHAHLCYLGQ